MKPESSEPKVLTVRQLIARLRALPASAKDLPVMADGCDCEGEALDVIVRPGGNVLVARYEAPKPKTAKELAQGTKDGRESPPSGVSIGFRHVREDDAQAPAEESAGAHPPQGRPLMPRPTRLKANKEIMRLLKRARAAATLENCGVEPKSAQEAVRVYLRTWVVGPLDAALALMCGDEDPNP
jgi:hypothetical protein